MLRLRLQVLRLAGELKLNNYAPVAELEDASDLSSDAGNSM